MGSGLSFRIAGIPVRIDLTFLLVAVLLGLGVRSGGYLIEWVAVVVGSVLLHELGHAVAYRSFGLTPRILLYGMGGLTFGEGRTLSGGPQIAVSLAGPLTGLLLVGAPAALIRASHAPTSYLEIYLLDDLIFVNVGWAVLNLLPVLPLDGGRVAAELLQKVRGEGGLRAARMLSIGVAAAGGVFALVNGHVYAALLAGLLAADNARQLSGARDATLMERLRAGHRAVQAGDSATAIREAEGVIGSTRAAAMRAAAVELVAWAHLREGRTADAASALERLPNEWSPSGYLRGTRALVAGDRAGGTEAIARALLDEGDWPPNFLPAAAIVRAGVLDDLVLRLLAEEDPTAQAGARSLASYLYRAGYFLEAARIYERLYDEDRGDRGQAAYNTSCSLARAGDRVGALGWLDRALDAGFADGALLDSDHDLDPLRETDAFRSLRARLHDAR